MNKPPAVKATFQTVERLGFAVCALTVTTVCIRILLGKGLLEMDSTAIPQWALVTLSLSYAFRYVQLQQEWRAWCTLVELQRTTAYRAVIQPDTVFPSCGDPVTILDFETGEPLVTNDPLVKRSNPDLFTRESWRFVAYPHGSVA